MPLFIWDNLQWWVAGAIVLLGLVMYGFHDLFNFSPRRIWAISSVSFAESIRKRILWITPLAIAGVIVVSQLQKPLDEQDAIRQTIKFTLFATGLLVTITAIILACTNLPKEIETRVIYTVVTKPTTRLEIVLGKVIGFARVSAAILLIMGLFALGYLQLRAWTLRKEIAERLSAGTVDALSRPTLEYWSQTGLLTSRTFERPSILQVFAKVPGVNDTKRWFYGSGEGEIVVPFRATPEQLIPAGVAGAGPGDGGVFLRVQIGFGPSEYGQATPTSAPAALPIGVAAPSSLPSTLPQGPPKTASLTIQILDENQNSLIDARQINKGEPITLVDPSGRTPVIVYIPPDVAPNLLKAPIFFVNLTGISAGVEYSVDLSTDPDPSKAPVCLIVPGATADLARFIGPLEDPRSEDRQPVPVIFRARIGNYGQQLRGGKPNKTPVAQYQFRGAEPRSNEGDVGFEMRVGIERSGEDADDDTEPTKVELTFVNTRTAAASQPLIIYPENNRTTYFSVPVQVLKGGDFDVYMRNETPGQYIGLQSLSLSMVASEESFNWNLVKSLTILWMLSILVVIISIFCSTFLSWPIAIVLTLVLLLGHWGVLQLGDATAPGIGNMVATDLGFQDPSKAKVVSASVEALSKLLNGLAAVLPDIGQFSAIEDIESGVTIPPAKLISPLLVLAAFGVPMLVLSYVFLRNKEVAP